MQINVDSAVIALRSMQDLKVRIEADLRALEADDPVAPYFQRQIVEIDSAIPDFRSVVYGRFA